MKTLIAAIMIATALASGCSPVTHTGDSVTAFRNDQILNPGAGGDAPVTGMDGVYAENSMHSYQDQGKGEQKQTDPDEYIFFKGSSAQTLDN